MTRLNRGKIASLGLTALTVSLGAFLIGCTMTVTAPATATDPTLPTCPTEDSINCVWDATVEGDGTGTSFVNLGDTMYYQEATESPVTPSTPAELPQGLTESPEPPADATAPATPNPDARQDWDTNTLECGVNAKPAIDQDTHGNWWAYCEPALIGE